MVTRREFLAASGGAIAALPFLNLALPTLAYDLPDVIKNSKAQFYNGLREFVNKEGAMTTDQNIVLTNTIYPFDIDAATPYFNQEIFRVYGDRSFSRGLEEGIRPNPQGYTTGRVSFNYQNLIELVTAQIDKTHPEIRNSLASLEKDLENANEQYKKHVIGLEDEWKAIALHDGLDPHTPEYRLRYLNWAEGSSYADQQDYWSQKIADVLIGLDGVRRSVYKTWEISILDNSRELFLSRQVVRPWYAQTERSFEKDEGYKLTDLKLADPKLYTPVLFDRSPLVAPDGDAFDKFMSQTSNFTFGSAHTDSSLDQGSSAWTAGASGGFLWWNASGGGSGSSSFSNSASNVASFEVRFDGLAEYLINRGPWYNPAALLDKNVEKITKDRHERDYLQYVAVSLIIARGTTLEVKFKQMTNSTDWSESAFQASGGVSLFGFGWGARGGNSSSHYSVTSSTDGLTITMKDDPNVARVLGARVEPFLTPVTVPKSSLPTTHGLTVRSKSGKAITLADVKAGKVSYMEYIISRNSALKAQK